MLGRESGWLASKEIRSDTDVKANSEAVKHANVKNTRTIVNLEANMRAGGEECRGARQEK